MAEEKKSLAEIMNMAGKFGSESVPEVKVNCNIGCMFDVITGTLVKGKWGNVFINGGAWATTAIGGPNNSFKSTLSKHILLAIMNNYPQSNANTLDTEVSGTGAIRYTDLASEPAYENLHEIDFATTPRWSYVTNAEIYGDVWWNEAKKYNKLKHDNKKITQLTTPYVTTKGEYIKHYIPTVYEIDSLSQFTVESVEIKIEDAQVGDKSRNMEDMANAKAKSKMIRDMPSSLNSSGGYVVMTAHVGQQFDLDPYNPNMKKHAIMGNKQLKHVSNAFDYNMNNLFEIMNAKPMMNPASRAPEFPKVAGDEHRGDTDLYELTMRVVRGKAGSTGKQFAVVCSQSDGFLPHLSAFWYLKTWKYGIGGNDRNYFIELYPDCNLSRTTVRNKIDSDRKLRRAIQLQSDLLLLQHVHKEGKLLPEERICTPKELYEDIKLLGYDWNELLETDNEWHFIEDAQERPTLTIVDLLNMRAGEYVPYWHQDAWKKLKRNNMAP